MLMPGWKAPSHPCEGLLIFLQDPREVFLLCSPSRRYPVIQAEGTGREEEVKEERRKGRKDGKTEGKEGKKEREKALGFLASYSASKTQTFSEAE